MANNTNRPARDDNHEPTRPVSTRRCSVVRLLGCALCIIALSLCSVPTWGDAVATPPAADPRPIPESDTSGGGYVVPGTNLWVSGFLNLTGEIPDSGPANATLDDLSLLLRYQPTPKLAFFNETAVDDVLVAKNGSGTEFGTDVFSLPRLYVEFVPLPELTLRLGKMLTPFGLWNVIRRAPLTWTVERPVITEEAFAVHVTGLSAAYQTTKSGWTIDATAYGQGQNELVRRSDEKSASAMVGGRFTAAHSIGDAFFNVGINGVAFEDRDSNKWENAVGVDTEANVAKHQVMAEANYVFTEGEDNWGLYLQDVVPLVGSFYGVSRYEHFEIKGDDTNGWLVGFAWRWKPQFVVKLDYQFADRDSDNLNRGVQAAVALSF